VVAAEQSPLRTSPLRGSGPATAARRFAASFANVEEPVHRLYGPTPEEIKIVEGASK